MGTSLGGAGALLVAGWLAATPVAAQKSTRSAEVSISCGALGVELEVCRTGAESWAAATGHRIRLVSTPGESNERLALYQQMLAAGVGDVDVFQIDVVWPGILGGHFLDLSEHVSAEVLGQHFPALVANATVKGRLVAMPWFTDVGLLYYRRDLLEQAGRPVPATWQELTETARVVQDAERAAGRDRMWGYVFQGKAYEGLTCNALEWVDGFGGGTIVGPEGGITIANPAAARALDLAGSWVGTISPPGVLNYAEDDARGVFQSGNAVFMRNWPYAWPLLNGAGSPVRGKVAVAALPKGGPEGKPTGALGGQQLAVSRYSRHPEAAIDLVRYLTGREEQKRRAVTGGFNPTLRALYRDPQVLGANPFLAELYGSFDTAVVRPSRVTGIKYNQVSNEFWNTVHDVLAGRTRAGEALARLERALVRISRGGRW